MWGNVLASVLQAVQIGASAYSTYQTNKQSKKLAAEQARQTLKTNNLAAAANAVSKTTSSISSTQGADRAINTLKIPVKSSTTDPTGSSSGVGLYIP